MTESMAETPDYDIEITGVIDAPRERVYEARWVDFPSRASSDLADPANWRGPNSSLSSTRRTLRAHSELLAEKLGARGRGARTRPSKTTRRSV
jgi:hypothetical protein